MLSFSRERRELDAMASKPNSFGFFKKNGVPTETLLRVKRASRKSNLPPKDASAQTHYN
ncbi:hypothetical protein DSO57_1012299 [Entomophthora muscae]|uniref:Uncharacterized protein n=1 Tax=Entomophthora muscae TaxID=34485 RepID=A0ACC2SIU3_9FUNG|nr:hypothetical protein DSO57_1012299 [Entomophthora muscae]